MGGECWGTKRLGEVANINPDAIGRDWPYPHLRYIDISSVGVGQIESPPQMIKVSDAPSRAKRLVRKGDTVLSTVRPNRRSMFFASEPSDDWVVSTGFVVLRPNIKLVEPRFLYTCVFNQDFTEYLITREKGAAYPAVSPEDIANAEIPIPPLKEQQAIACILGAFDDKIELNRQMNRTLEEMARAIFKSWFVDFDPVRAKAAVRRAHPSWTNEQVSRAACPKLKPEIAELFPDAFEDSELGEIPKGWEVKPLPELIEVNPTRTLRKGEFAPYLDMANMPTRGHSPDTVTERPFGSGMRFVNGDTLVARITPCLENGKTAFVDFLTDGQVGWGSTEYIVLRPKPPLPVEFAYCLARSDGFRDFAIQRMTGSSGRQRVPAELLAHFRLVDADRSVTELFGRLVQPLFARAGAATRESRILAALRDALLPKLISGELRVKDAEKFVERVAI